MIINGEVYLSPPSPPASQRRWTTTRCNPPQPHTTTYNQIQPHRDAQAALGSLLGRSWALLRRSWDALGRSWDALGTLLDTLGHSCSAKITPRQLSRVILGDFGWIFNRFWYLQRRLFTGFSYSYHRLRLLSRRRRDLRKT